MDAYCNHLIGPINRCKVAIPKTLETAIAEHLNLRYRCDLEHFPESLRKRFIPLSLDDGARVFLERVWANRPGAFRNEMRGFLREYASDFDVNGLLNIYPMHVLSTDQWRTILPKQGGALLDIGAGNGDVTDTLAPLFDEVATTETSRAMAWRLRRSGYTCHRLDVTTSDVPGGPFDMITCLNVLDRCAAPLSLLAQLKQLLRDDGVLVLALVLPYKPCHYKGAAITMPDEQLAIDKPSWEGAVMQLCGKVLQPGGWHVESFSRVPYLSGGDRHRPFYELDDVIVVCQKG